MAINRYRNMVANGKIKRLPLVKIPKRNSDCYEVYKRNKSSLDNISYKYYDDPNYVWLIMMANQEFGSMEYDIPDNAILRIPFPLDTAISDYEYNLDKLLTKYNYK